MIDEKYLKIRWFSGTGAGGQHRNRTQNCCEVIHLPTGFKVTGQNSRSRTENKRQAIEGIEAQLKQMAKTETLEKVNYLREKAASNGRVRTYDFKQGLVTDHRSGKTAEIGQFLDAKIDLTKFSQTEISKNQ